MNSDDPKLTAYALDELDPVERAEIEQLLREDPAARAEVEETATFAAQLRRQLKAEAAAPLTDAQRAELLAAANTETNQTAGHPERSGGGEMGGAQSKDPVRPEQAPAPSAIITFPVRKVILWAAAACLVLGVSAALFFPAIGVMKVSSRKMPALARSGKVEQGLIALPAPNSEAIALAEPAAAPTAPEPLPATSPASSNPDDSRGLVLENSGRLTASTDSRSFSIDSPANPQSDVEGLNIAGNTRTKDKVIRREPPVAPGDVFNSSSGGKDVKTRANDASDAYGIASYNETRSTAVRSLDKAWNNPVRRFDLPGTPSAEGGQAINPAKPAPAKLAATTAGRRGGISELHPYASAQPSAPLSIAMNEQPVGSKQLADEITEMRALFEQKTKDTEDRRRSADKPASDLNGPHPTPLPDSTIGNTEAYDAITDNAFLAARDNPLSTFSIDVDTASYANVRRFLNQQTRPPKGAVRIEELLNYFTYDYPQPDGDAPFSATMEVAACPWAPEHRLVRIGLKGREIAEDKRPATNLVFLIDVSGSMQPKDKLPLLKKCLALLVERLTPEDTVSIAVYAGASGIVLEPTHNKREIRTALDRLESGGSTNGGAGIQLAYRLAEQSFIKGGVNRVILATDGDFNVGVTSQSELTDLIERKAKSGVFLTVLGFGMGNLKDSTLEKLADKGNGNYAYIDTLNEGRKVLVEQMNGTLVTIAKDVKIQVEFNPAQAAAYRLIGYENRLLAKEDFNDDKKDAGEIGAGHTVTALYEVVPVGKAVPGTPAVDALKYRETGVSSQKSEGAPLQSEIRNPKSEISAELLTLKLRYKQPDGDTSKLLEFPLTDRGETWEKSSRDFRFAAAVASFGMLLRDSPHKGNATWSSARELAMEGRGEDRTGYRGEFLTLLDKAKVIGR